MTPSDTTRHEAQAAIPAAKQIPQPVTLATMQTPTDALRWALSRIPEDMRGDYYARAAEILDANT